MKLAFVCLPLLCLSGCIANDGLGTDSVSQTNVYNLSRLNVGMNQATVLRIMRHPYSQQTFQMDEAVFDVWFYVTSPTVLGQTRMVPMNLTPLTFKNGQLIGWGNSYYNYLTKRQEQALKAKNQSSPSNVKSPEEKEDINLEKVLQPSTDQQKNVPQTPNQPNRGSIQSPNQQKSQPMQQQSGSQNQKTPPPSSGQKSQPTPPQSGNQNQKTLPPSPGQKEQPTQKQGGSQNQKTPPSQTQDRPNWGPIETPQKQQQPTPQPSSTQTSSHLSMSRKPQKTDQTSPESQKPQEREAKKPPLTDEDNEMLEKESEQSFDQT